MQGGTTSGEVQPQAPQPTSTAPPPPPPPPPLRADSKGRTAFMRHILGVTDEERQQRRCVSVSVSVGVGVGGGGGGGCGRLCTQPRLVAVRHGCLPAGLPAVLAPPRPALPHPTNTPARREEILGTTVKDFRQFADVLAAVRDKGQVVAVTSGELSCYAGVCRGACCWRSVAAGTADADSGCAAPAALRARSRQAGGCQRGAAGLLRCRQEGALRRRPPLPAAPVDAGRSAPALQPGFAV